MVLDVCRAILKLVLSVEKKRRHIWNAVKRRSCELRQASSQRAAVAQEVVQNIALDSWDQFDTPVVAVAKMVEVEEDTS